MDIILFYPLVILTTIGRKNLIYTHVNVYEILHSVQNDIEYI